MKRFVLSTVALLLTLTSFAQVHVSGYYRKNGTYVKPYVRSSPDNNPTNNYGYPGNYNPNKGQISTGNPETYLRNYYNKNNNPTTRYYIGNSNVLQGGQYLKLNAVQSTYIIYDIYDLYDAYSGFLTINTDKQLRLFNRDNNFYKQIDNFNDPITIGNKEPLNPTIIEYKNPYFQSPSVQSNTVPTSHVNSKSAIDSIEYNGKTTYLKDKNGNYTGYYLELNYFDDIVKKYTRYDHLNNEVGSLEVYSNGEKIYYNVTGKMTKHIIPKKN